MFDHDEAEAMPTELDGLPDPHSRRTVSEICTTSKPRLSRSCKWMNDAVSIRQSLIHGRGVFATRAIATGDVVVRLGGTVFSIEAVRVHMARPESLTGLSEGF